VKPSVVISSLDADFSLSVRHILEVEGFATDLAMGPVETIVAVKEKHNVGLIVDGGNEFTVGLCKVLKADATTDHVRIVTLVPAGAARRFEAFLEVGVEEAFMRPVEPDRYLRALKRLLGADEEQPMERVEPQTISHAGLIVDARAHRITYEGRDIHLGPIEFVLLHQMISEPTRAFRREELASRAWPQGVFVDPKTVNVHIGRLRKALSPFLKVDIIRTVRGIGYGLEVQGS
jgi:two-component system phosphate regulon response regulator PhoB